MRVAVRLVLLFFVPCRALFWFLCRVVVAVNDAPALAALESTPASFTENATELAVTATLTLADANYINLTATVATYQSCFVSDHSAKSAVLTRALTITAVNDAPTLTLDASAVSWTKMGAVVRLVFAVTINDMDGSAISKETVSITGSFAWTDLLSWSAALLTVACSAPIFTITCLGTLVQYQALLASVSP